MYVSDFSCEADSRCNTRRYAGKVTVVAAALTESRMQSNTDTPPCPHMSPMSPDLPTLNFAGIKEEEEEFELLQLSEIPHVQASSQTPTSLPVCPLPHTHEVSASALKQSETEQTRVSLDSYHTTRIILFHVLYIQTVTSTTKSCHRKKLNRGQWRSGALRRRAPLPSSCARNIQIWLCNSKSWMCVTLLSLRKHLRSLSLSLISYPGEGERENPSLLSRDLCRVRCERS